MAVIVQYAIMLDAGFVRENRELVEKRLKDRGITLDLSEFFRIDEERRSALREVEQLKHRTNLVSKEIGEAKARGEDMEARKEEMRVVKEKIKELDDQVRNTESKLNEFLLNVPNLPNESVPVGATAADNVEVRRHEGT